MRTRLLFPEFVTIWPVDQDQPVDSRARQVRRAGGTRTTVRVNAQVEFLGRERAQAEGGAEERGVGEIVMSVRECTAKGYTPTSGDSLRQTEFRSKVLDAGTVLFLGAPTRFDEGRLWMAPLLMRQGRTAVESPGGAS